MACNNFVISICGLSIHRLSLVMALRSLVCHLLRNPHRCVFVSASRTQGTAAVAQPGQYSVVLLGQVPSTPGPDGIVVAAF